MPNERTFARYVSQGLRAYGHPQRHEDAISVGVPDLSFAAGGVTAWVELKAIDKWPVRESTTVKLRTFTYEQLNWLMARAKHTPHVFMMLKVEEGKEYLLFNHDTLKFIHQGVTKSQMLKMALPGSPWTRRIDFERLRFCLTNEWETCKEDWHE